MVDPEGTLTAAQYEILEVIWRLPEAGLTVAEIWHEIGSKRSIARTTILNQVDRLEKRGWLTRHDGPDGFRYSATRSREDASGQMAAEFVEAFFGGSAANLMMSLLGNKKLSLDDVKQLKELLESRTTRRKPH